jgi:hypothetical protein
MGRPPKLTRHQQREALAALAEGSVTQADLACRFNVSQATISRLAQSADRRGTILMPSAWASTKTADQT